MNSTSFPGFTDAALAAVRAGADRPLLLTGATVHTLDPLIGTVRGADLLVVGEVVVGVGPGIVTAAEDDGAIVVDAHGTTVLPSRPALVHGSGGRCGAGTLAPGARADLVVVDGDAADPAAAVGLALDSPGRIRAALADGVPVHWAGLPLGDGPGAPARPRPEEAAVDPDRVGVWIDTGGFLHQELGADGRYDETRGGRPHAFQGRFWTDGDRIDYLDDLGFWAFGTFDGDTLHHAGYTLHRGEAR